VTITNNASLVDFVGPRAIDGRLTIETNPALSSLDLVDLARAGDIAIRNNAVLPDALLAKLTSVSTLEISGNPVLDFLDLTKLTAAHEVHIDANRELASCDVLAAFAHITAEVLEQSGNADDKPCTPQ
jgi:hypothetical protein